MAKRGAFSCVTGNRMVYAFAVVFIGLLGGWTTCTRSSRASLSDMAVLCCYNPLSLCGAARDEEVSRELRHCDVVVLSGTQLRADRHGSLYDFKGKSKGKEGKGQGDIATKLGSLKIGKEHRRILALLVKQVLASALLAREACSIMDSYLLDKSSPEYSAALLKRSSELGRSVESYLSILAEGLVTVLALLIRTCRLQKVYDSTQVRLLLSFQEGILMPLLPEEPRAKLQELPGLSMRLAFHRAHGEAGARHLSGRQPPSNMERLLQAALDDQQGEAD